MSFSIKQILRKYFIMGSQNCNRNPAEILEEAVKAGITAFQFREKGDGCLAGEAKLNLGKQLRAICQRADIPFIVNDDIELVDLLDADGIHVGQDDIPVESVRKLFPNKIVGLSVSNAKELAISPIDLVDYVGAGPIFDTTTKLDAKEAVGLEWITNLRREFTKLPIVGIGGITTENATSVIESGADGVSVISAITAAPDIKRAVTLL
ncbi:thiamine phosphate synthase [Oceanobacillus chungangensis]|uniref:Thiamine-phosphate synthase n=1 Tax=Oceanobacillus chungangensis TaxID=1229152 RepID=A0A3D8Q0X9_9BACI|nr:thiamine phosphate synthase [Oceanobacillus chungangensis]RDW21231.1 thiamine phosphate synthase [Oceanobacillus chungangensis]